MRFIQPYINSHLWDTHNNLAADLNGACDRTDRPIAAVLRDPKQRGLLGDTLVVWGGEFGRLPIAQLPADEDGRKAGRDHNKNAFCTWMAGGGVKGGTTYGATDELGLHAVENRVSARLARHDPPPARAAPRPALRRGQRAEGEADRRGRGLRGEGHPRVNEPLAHDCRAFG